MLTPVFRLPEQCENKHVLRSQNGFLRYLLQTRRWTAAFLRPASVRCRLLAASSAALLRRDTSLAQCQHSSSSAQVTVVSICTTVFSVVTRLPAELFGARNTVLLLNGSETGFLTLSYRLGWQVGSGCNPCFREVPASESALTPKSAKCFHGFSQYFSIP